MNIKALAIDRLRSGLTWKEKLRRGLDVLTQAPPTPQAAIDGGEAYERGGVPSDNPYPPGTQHHEDWAWGFEETSYRIEYERQEAASL